MRRKEKEIRDRLTIEAIIQASFFCRLGLSEGDRPYIVPLCFGYDDMTLYFHGAREGKKIDIIRKNHHVCFELDLDAELIEDDKACSWGVRYRSVIGSGKAELIGNLEEKRKALAIIMAHYSRKRYHFPDKAIQTTAVIKVVIDKISGKQSGFDSQTDGQ
jgi:nitroimidazol reductase NimA-like FMN-containing flavoprotein (pyridoxamine 5'-phosphate oxidase superfamily)